MEQENKKQGLEVLCTKPVGKGGICPGGFNKVCLYSGKPTPQGDKVYCTCPYSKE